MRSLISGAPRRASVMPGALQRAVVFSLRGLERLALVIIGALLLAACAGLGESSTVTFTESQLQEMVERKLNVDQRLLSVFDVNIGRPRVTLQSDVNRLLTGLDVAVKNPVTGNLLKGNLAISGRLAWDARERAVVLADPRTESFAIEGVPTEYSTQINRLGGLLAEQFLKDFALYKPQTDDLRYQGRAVEPTQMLIRNGRLEITLAPRA